MSTWPIRGADRVAGLLSHSPRQPFRCWNQTLATIRNSLKIKSGVGIKPCNEARTRRKHLVKHEVHSDEHITWKWMAPLYRKGTQSSLWSHPLSRDHMFVRVCQSATLNLVVRRPLMVSSLKLSVVAPVFSTGTKCAPSCTLGGLTNLLTL